jgi:hypothetical protein
LRRDSLQNPFGSKTIICNSNGYCYCRRRTGEPESTWRRWRCRCLGLRVRWRPVRGTSSGTPLSNPDCIVITPSCVGSVIKMESRDALNLWKLIMTERSLLSYRKAALSRLTKPEFRQFEPELIQTRIIDLQTMKALGQPRMFRDHSWRVHC